MKLRNAPQRRHAIEFVERQFFEFHREIRHPALGIITPAGIIQVEVQARHPDETANPHGDDRDDRRQHAFGGEHFPPKFAVEHAHQAISSGAIRWALTSELAIVPEPMRSVRSLIPLMAELWVIIITVMPSSTFRR